MENCNGGIEKIVPLGLESGFGKRDISREKEVCIGTISHDDFSKNTSFGNKIKACILELILETKGFVKHARLFRIGLHNGKS